MIQINAGAAAPGDQRRRMFKNPLARDVVIALVVKTLIVVAASTFVFGANSRPVMNATTVSARLLSSSGQGEP